MGDELQQKKLEKGSNDATGSGGLASIWSELRRNITLFTNYKDFLIKEIIKELRKLKREELDEIGLLADLQQLLQPKEKGSTSQAQSGLPEQEANIVSFALKFVDLSQFIQQKYPALASAVIKFNVVGAMLSCVSCVPPSSQAAPLAASAAASSSSQPTVHPDDGVLDHLYGHLRRWENHKLAVSSSPAWFVKVARAVLSLVGVKNNTWLMQQEVAINAKKTKNEIDAESLQRLMKERFEFLLNASSEKGIEFIGNYNQLRSMFAKFAGKKQIAAKIQAILNAVEKLFTIPGLAGEKEPSKLLKLLVGLHKIEGQIDEVKGLLNAQQQGTVINTLDALRSSFNTTDTLKSFIAAASSVDSVAWNQCQPILQQLCQSRKIEDLQLLDDIRGELIRPHLSQLAKLAEQVKSQLINSKECKEGEEKYKQICGLLKTFEDACKNPQPNFLLIQSLAVRLAKALQDPAISTSNPETREHLVTLCALINPSISQSVISPSVNQDYFQNFRQLIEISTPTPQHRFQLILDELANASAERLQEAKFVQLIKEQYMQFLLAVEHSLLSNQEFAREISERWGASTSPVPYLTQVFLSQFGAGLLESYSKERLDKLLKNAGYFMGKMMDEVSSLPSTASATAYQENDHIYKSMNMLRDFARYKNEPKIRENLVVWQKSFQPLVDKKLLLEEQQKLLGMRFASLTKSLSEIVIGSQQPILKNKLAECFSLMREIVSMIPDEQIPESHRSARELLLQNLQLSSMVGETLNPLACSYILDDAILQVQCWMNHIVPRIISYAQQLQSPKPKDTDVIPSAPPVPEPGQQSKGQKSQGTASKMDIWGIFSHHFAKIFGRQDNVAASDISLSPSPGK